MKISKLFKSIFFKIAILFILISILYIILFFFMTTSFSNRIAEELIKDYSLKMVLLLNKMIVKYLIKNDDSAIRHILDSYVENTQILYIAIYGTDLHIVVSAGEYDVNNEITPENVSAMTMEKNDFIFNGIDDKSFTVISKIRSAEPDDRKAEFYGYLQLRQGTAFLTSKLNLLNSINLMHSTSFLVFIIIGFFLILFLLIFKPIKEFRDAIDHIRHGDYSFKLPIKSKNEIDELKIRFNSMVNEIRIQNIEINHYSNTLEEQVIERTKEFEKTNTELKETLIDLEHTHNRLIQADKLASIGQLAAGVAHEINNPIGYVKSNIGSLMHYLQIIISFVEKAKKISSIQKIAGETSIDTIIADINPLIEDSMDGILRVEKIVKNLKNFVHTDKKEIKYCDLNEMIENTLAILANEIKYKAIVEKDFGNLPLIKGYPQQLSQVFLNMIINAVQAIKKKGVIKIRTTQDDNNIMITFEDNGLGMDNITLSKIFEPFYTTKDIGEGTGLGLSIAYEIIKAHGGIIVAESEINVGSLFTISLPLETVLD